MMVKMKVSLLSSAKEVAKEVAKEISKEVSLSSKQEISKVKNSFDRNRNVPTFKKERPWRSVPDWILFIYCLLEKTRKTGLSK